MNWYCENMGTDDDFTVPNESSSCNLMRYARYYSGEWGCFGELVETTSLACIDDNGERIDCKGGDFNTVCSRPAELTAIKNKRQMICPGIHIFFRWIINIILLYSIIHVIYYILV